MLPPRLYGQESGKFQAKLSEEDNFCQSLLILQLIPQVKMPITGNASVSFTLDTLPLLAVVLEWDTEETTFRGGEEVTFKATFSESFEGLRLK